ncbi:hypothetical protein [Prolixibacter bellariivorans]|uniref:hypothetical protein n=1 Tax=Prolixibacter bellariivorans TaxID=314319 RepID=UPI0011DE4D8A|nr:hypothetical protein [Prolixibacter bellariivorans]
MKLFQESETLEAFERSLNDPNSHINNLDLNGDNLVDYISVVDYVDGDVHNIVLRTQLNRNETQDIAVFTVQRFDDGTARIQLIGDEALYGKNYIVEPIYADSQETPNPGYMGNTTVIATPAPVTVTTYQVAFWPIIRFIYRPGYVRWHSVWGWGHYPSYWNSWRPYYWHTYFAIIATLTTTIMPIIAIGIIIGTIDTTISITVMCGHILRESATELEEVTTEQPTHVRT